MARPAPSNRSGTYRAPIPAFSFTHDPLPTSSPGPTSRFLARKRPNSSEMVTSLRILAAVLGGLAARATSATAAVISDCDTPSCPAPLDPDYLQFVPYGCFASGSSLCQ